jgi:hypothetical protein
MILIGFTLSEVGFLGEQGVTVIIWVRRYSARYINNHGDGASGQDLTSFTFARLGSLTAVREILMTPA